MINFLNIIIIIQEIKDTSYIGNICFLCKFYISLWNHCNFCRCHFYSGSAGLGFYVSKGFFDTIPKALDEAAIVDGATKWDVFSKIIMPLSKPIVVSTIMTSFMAPWLDFIFAKVIAGADPRYYTVAIGLYTMLTKENIVNWYACFAAGAVCVSIPIAALFLYLQKYYAEGMSGAVKG